MWSFLMIIILTTAFYLKLYIFFSFDPLDIFNFPLYYFSLTLKIYNV